MDFTIALCHCKVKLATVCTQSPKEFAVSLFPNTWGVAMNDCSVVSSSSVRGGDLVFRICRS
jgi:hypothetical protein